MKKILFVIDSINCGGAERSLINLLNNLDYEKYDVDLLYFYHGEEYYRSLIPKQVHILDVDINTEIALSSSSVVKKNIFNFSKFPIVFIRLWGGLMGKINKKNYFRRKVTDWSRLRKYVPDLKTEYDAAIGYLENLPTYYVIDKVINAKKHIVWMRTDYKTAGYSPSLDFPYFKKSDLICVLSEEMKNNFIKVFPSMENKVIIFSNLNDINLIINKSKESVEFDDEFEGIKIISVGTIRQVKGYDVSLRACIRLARKGYNFRWYVLGSGEEYAALNKDIENKGMSDKFILMGNKTNPYAYVAKSDIFVQCSYREGFSTTVFEAKCLKMPIVITDAPGMGCQIENGVNGYVSPVGNDEQIANAIEALIASEKKRQDFSQALESFVNGYKNEICKKLNCFDIITN